MRAWREPELGLRDARIHLTPDGRLIAVSFPAHVSYADRENIIREINRAFVDARESTWLASTRAGAAGPNAARL